MRNGLRVCEVTLEFRPGPYDLANFLLSEVMGVSFFIEAYDLIRLTNGLLDLLSLFASLQVGLLDTLASHAQLVGLTIAAQFRHQEVSYI